jgi:hypothetical protein
MARTARQAMLTTPTLGTRQQASRQPPPRIIAAYVKKVIDCPRYPAKTECMRPATLLWRKATSQRTQHG